MSFRIVITGGGTGGHLSVASAFVQECKKRNFECYFIGSLRGQDRSYFENDDRLREKFFLDTMGVVNKHGFEKILSVFVQIKSFYKALRILHRIKPHFIISVGGYSAAPASFAAILLKIPLIIHEQNAKMGRLNALLKSRATLFFSSYSNDSPIKDYPVNEVFFKNAHNRNKLSCILFMGGSQGARVINQLALSSAKKIIAKGIRIIHQCGLRELKDVQNSYIQMGINPTILTDGDTFSNNNFEVLLFGFYRDLSLVFREADFAISRSGASSLWELSANGLPALFIPYPYAAGNHQFFNAEFLASKNLCILMPQSDVNAEVLLEQIYQLSHNLKLLEYQSIELQKLCSPNATSKIIEYIIETLQHKKC